MIDYIGGKSFVQSNIVDQTLSVCLSVCMYVCTYVRTYVYHFALADDILKPAEVGNMNVMFQS
jgi:hypothetical protein